MRVWFKLLLGAALGIVLSFFVSDNQRFSDILVWLEEFTLRVGRYTIIPVLVFSLTIGIYELRQDGQFWRLMLKNFLLIAGVTVFVIAAGVMATLVFPPGRIPVLTEEQIDVIDLDIAGSIQALFPYNMFSVLASDGVYLFPACVFAFFFGMGLSYDRSYTKPVIALVDSLSRIFYHIASFFIEILGFLIIVLSCYWTVRFRGVLQAQIFFDMIVFLGILGAVLGFGILPLLLYFLKPKTNPWAVLYGSLGPAIAAFFSGDINFSLPILFCHTKENFGAKRRTNSVSLVLFTTFCRAGSAMVAAAAFIVIIKSYSSLGITLPEILSISIRACAVSFLLARYPGDSAYIALAVLCIGHGRGFEAGYLILKPLAFYLIAVGTFLDVVIASFGAYVLSHINGLASEEKKASQFI